MCSLIVLVFKRWSKATHSYHTDIHAHRHTYRLDVQHLCVCACVCVGVYRSIVIEYTTMHTDEIFRGNWKLLLSVHDIICNFWYICAPLNYRNDVQSVYCRINSVSLTCTIIGASPISVRHRIVIRSHTVCSNLVLTYSILLSKIVTTTTPVSRQCHTMVKQGVEF